MFDNIDTAQYYFKGMKDGKNDTLKYMMSKFYSNRTRTFKFITDLLYSP